MNTFLSTAYLAPIQYYSKFLFSDKITIEVCDNYQKQSYRNRCSILSANGVTYLSIPVERSEVLKMASKDIRIAEHGNWQHTHWNALISAYNSTPFFEYYRDDFQPFYEKRFKYLHDLNEELRIMICSLIGIGNIEVSYTQEYKSGFASHELDLREAIHPKRDWQNTDSNFVSVPYYQVFEELLGFSPNLSIVDLLFNMGNESLLVLHESIKTTLK